MAADMVVGMVVDNQVVAVRMQVVDMVAVVDHMQVAGMVGRKVAVFAVARALPLQELAWQVPSWSLFHSIRKIVH